MRRLITVLFLVGSLFAAGQQRVEKLTIDIPATSLEAALKLLEQHSHVHISYEYTRVKGIRVEAHSYKEATLETICKDLLKGTSLMFKRRGDQIIIGPVMKRDRTLSGYVEDAVSGERLIGVSLAAPEYEAGTITNAYGFYSITLPDDSFRIQLSYLGYERLDTIVEAQQGGSVNFKLKAFDRQLGEVTIRGGRTESKVPSFQMSSISLSAATIQTTPRLLGESDLLKTMQLLPGVKQGTEATSALLVRGGTPDQNLILLDGAPLYNPLHLLGLFSSFNTSAIKDVTLYKGAFPARYGGRLSSVVDVVTKDGDMNKIHGDFSVGLLAAEASLEGPVKKGKTTFMLSGRRAYPSFAARLYMQNQDDPPDNIGLNFYDINAKLHHKFSDKDKLYLSFYNGRDKLKATYNYVKNNDDYQDYYRSNTNARAENLIGTIRWNHVYSPKLFSNIMLIGSDYLFRSGFYQAGEVNRETFTDNQQLKSGIRDYGMKADFEYHPMPAHSIKTGVAYMYRIFTPGVLWSRQTQKEQVSVDAVNNNHEIYANEISAYAEDEWNVLPELKVNIGLHSSTFLVEKQTYHSLQPRLNMGYLLPGDWMLKASYSRMTQYIHLLANNSISLPTDLWVPATKQVKPQDADQFTLGVAKSMFKNRFEFSIEGYYKYMQNVIEYREGADYLTSSRGDNWQSQVAAGEEEAYGAELLLQKKTGKLTGWIGYTLAWANRLIPQVNYGNMFPYKYDRRHDLHIAAVYQLRRGIELSGTWTYQSAAPFTVPVASYEGISTPMPGIMQMYNTQLPVKYISRRNNVRVMDYHRLDLGVNFIRYKKNGMIRTWNISVLNVYNRFNPFFYFLDNYDKGAPRAKLTAANLIPVLPSFSYRLKF